MFIYFAKVPGSACTLLSANNNSKLVSYTRYGISLGTVTIILTHIFLVFSLYHPIGFAISTRILLLLLVMIIIYFFNPYFFLLVCMCLLELMPGTLVFKFLALVLCMWTSILLAANIFYFACAT